MCYSQNMQSHVLFCFSFAFVLVIWFWVLLFLLFQRIDVVLRKGLS